MMQCFLADEEVRIKLIENMRYHIQQLLFQSSKMFSLFVIILCYITSKDASRWFVLRTERAR